MPRDDSAAAPQSAAPDDRRSERLDRRTLRNVGVLAATVAVMSAQLPIHFTFGPLAGALLAPSPIWATAPITAVVLTNMLTAGPIALAHGRFGRRPIFFLGALFGAAGGALSAYAIVIESFWLFMLGSAFLGVYQANQNLFRFAATDTASHRAKPIAMSWVMAGGLVAAFIAPVVGSSFKDYLAPIPFAGVYLGVVALNLIGALPLFALDAPKPKPAPLGSKPAGRPIAQILREEPQIRIAMFCGMVSYALMALVMTSTSTAMIFCGHTVDEAGIVVGAHVVAMFAPSFFTGWIINRIGVRTVISIGLALLASCAVVALSGIELTQFFVALILLGVGWNFAFIGASSLLAQSWRDEERSRVQAVNETAVFGLVAFASLMSGQIMHFLGWEAVQIAMLPILAIAALTLALSGRRAGAAAV